MPASAKSGRRRSTATSRCSHVQELNDTAVVAALGMGVVFFFLAVLSALMFAAKRAVDRAEAPAAAATGGGATPAGSGAGTPTPRFVAAAVVAFLAAEPGAGADVTARPWRRMQERG